MTATNLVVQAPAKINPILRVLERRPDGFHAVWSVMQTVGLEADLAIQVRPGGTGRIDLSCDQPGLAVDQSNLVHRAARLVLDRSGQRADVSIRLTKRIPMGAGLGGGSSDAAATMIGLDRALSLGWSLGLMSEVGAQLGSDVPFFFVAPSACVTGRGEVVQPIRLSGHRWIVLVNPGFPVETKWAYQQLSSTRGAVRPVSDTMKHLASGAAVAWESLSLLAENDFEPPVFEAHPVLGEIKRHLLTHGAEAALLSGSGATVFGVFAEQATAGGAAASWGNRPGMKVFVVPTCDKGIQVTSG